ncbi:MAG: DsbA family protein [Pseudolabrys sp.]
MKITRTRNGLFAGLLALAAVAALLQPIGAAAQSSDPLSRESILRDPAAPTTGNPKGDLTIVEWFDYQCPYCKKMNPDLLKVVKADGHIRLVFKDWPVFGKVSVQAARLVLAAKYQGKYVQAHDALMAIRGKLSADMIVPALAKAGIDTARAERDLVTHKKAIDALLARNQAQALGLGFRGTPGFVIGHFRVPGAFSAATLRAVIKDARAALKKEKKGNKPAK